MEVAYLGSLSTACKAGRGLFGSLIDSCGNFEYAVDPISAKQLAAATMPGLALDVLPLSVYGTAREGARLTTLGAVDLVAQAPPTMTGAFTGAELSPWATIAGTGQAVAVYNLLAVGAHLVSQASRESEARARTAEAQPCIDRLSREAAAVDYSSTFAAALSQAARAVGTAVDVNRERLHEVADRKTGASHRMTTSLPILRLRESGQPQHLALELGLTVRLEAPDNGRVDYYNTLLYAPALPLLYPMVPRSPLYMQFVTERAKGRPMSEWCGPDGHALLKGEVAVALKSIASQLVQDLK
jgi:hypothetical protein